jgi:hypothetical protein
MQYIVLIEFLPNTPNIWVARLTPEDPDYIFDTEEEAIAKAQELQDADTTGRLYKAVVLDGSIAL